MYGNPLPPSKLFGIVLLLFSGTAMSIWATGLVTAETPAFDTRGLILLTVGTGLLILSLLFFRRVRWVRVVMSVLLHLLGLALLATLLYTLPTVETTVEHVVVVAFTLLGVGLLFVALLTLHGNAMRSDFAAAPIRAGRSCRRRYLAATAAGILVLLALAAWQIVPLLVAKPTITEDYLAQANQANKPSDYDPNFNAAPHYEKLFRQFTPLPQVLKDGNAWKSWPEDLSDDELKALEEWASVNDSVLPALAQAARCPYWWFEMKSGDGTFSGVFERESTGGPLSGIQVPYLDESRDCAWGIVTLAKYRAARGEIGPALRWLTDLHMLGMHRHRAGTLVDQLTGLAICMVDYDAVLALLGHCQVEGQILRQTLNTFAPRILQIDVPRFSEVEHLYGYDNIQRTFTDDGNGNGRLIPARLYESKKRRSHLYTWPIPYLDAVRICLTHPDRRQTVALFESYFTMVKELARKTPWELELEDTSYQQRLKEWLSGNYYLQDGSAAIARCIQLGWRGRVSGAAVVTTLAILTHKAQKGRFPESLRQLVEEGLLSSVPIDPYSGEPLVYTVNGDDFTLYSVGEDFVDNGGQPCEWDDQSGGDHVVWPVPVRQQ
jgi:hypothetical protein